MFALPDGIHLFREEDLSAALMRMMQPYEVVPFTVLQRESIFFKVPIHFTPPWEALPPAYVCCLTENQGPLRKVLRPEKELVPARLLVEDRLSTYTSYKAAAISDLEPEARIWLERAHQTHRVFFSCLYENGLKKHPLFPSFLSRYEQCQI